MERGGKGRHRYRRGGKQQICKKKGTKYEKRKNEAGRSDRGSGICGSVLLCGTSGSEYPFLGSVDVYDHCRADRGGSVSRKEETNTF